MGQADTACNFQFLRRAVFWAAQETRSFSEDGEKGGHLDPFLAPPTKVPGAPYSPILSQESGVVWLLGIPDLDRDGEEEIVLFSSPLVPA